jgi:rubrerythrin
MNAKSKALEDRLEKDMESTAIDMEVASIKVYERLISESDSEHDKEIYREILADEKDHERKVKAIRGSTRNIN